MVGSVLIFQFNKKTKYTSLASPSLMIVSGIQAFLTSMILGVVFFSAYKIGNTPFLTLQEFNPTAPIWSMNPDFIEGRKSKE